jgi:transcriptional regulator with XRE-family HTH domain
MSRSEKILSDTLARLMKASRDLRSQGAVAKAANIDQRTVGRIVNQEHSPSLDKLDALAKAFGLEAWEMIAPADKREDAAALTQIELRLLDSYRMLKTKDDQDKVVAFVKFVATQPDASLGTVQEVGDAAVRQMKKRRRDNRVENGGGFKTRQRVPGSIKKGGA